MSSPNNQSNILQGSVNKDILLKLKGKRTIKGKLKSFDQYMNLTLENATEVLEGDKVQQMGEIFIKGENIVIKRNFYVFYAANDYCHEPSY